MTSTVPRRISAPGVDPMPAGWMVKEYVPGAVPEGMTSAKESEMTLPAGSGPAPTDGTTVGGTSGTLAGAVAGNAGG